jgi:UDP-N-acetylmuramate dehydrogenase
VRPPSLAVTENVALAPLSTLGVGGAARAFTRAETTGDVVAAHQWCAESGSPLFVLGGGSNLVIADGGFRGLVLQIAMRGISFAPDGEHTHVRAAAGEPWDGLVAASVANDLAGIESLSGIPGSVGGTPIQNVGAYGQEVAETIESVTAFDRHRDELVTLPAAACEFSYRMSRFKNRDLDRFVVCEVTYRLRHGTTTPTYPDVLRYLEQERIESAGVADLRAAVCAIRRRKGMVLDAADPDTRSVGSFFMNPVVSTTMREHVSATAGAASPGYPLDADRVKLAAAWLIERAGFCKGYADGAVGISSKHPLALVNRGGATARDVLRLAVHIKRTVVDRFGVWLRPEPIFVGFDHDPDVEYLQEHGPAEGGSQAHVDTAD